MLDLRSITSKDLSGSGNSWGGRVDVEWDCDHRTPDGEMVLWDDSVNNFLWEFVESEEDLEINESKNYLDGIGFSLKYYHVMEIPIILHAWKKRMAHLMTCISYTECPCCGRVNYTFINPDQLDSVYHKDDCGCSGEEYVKSMLEEEEELC